MSGESITWARPWVVMVLVGLLAQAVPGTAPAAAIAADSPAPAAGGLPDHAMAVSAGGLQSCAVQTDGTLACWTDDGTGGWDPPAGTYTAVSAGGRHACAIATDGTLACWGDDAHGQASPPAGTFLAVSAGEQFSCAIRTDGTLACWGDDSEDQATPPTGRFTELSAGETHACAIRTDETLACWGYDLLYDPPTGTFIAVDAFGPDTCAIRTDGTLACWGRDFSLDWAPVTLPTGTFTAVSGSCGIRTDETLACGSTDFDDPVTPPTGTFVALSVPYAIRTDGTLIWWGRIGTQAMVVPAWPATSEVPIAWRQWPSFAAVASYDVRYQRTRWDGAVGPWVTWLSQTSATAATFSASPGYTYCFSVRARGADGIASDWRDNGDCMVAPLDDRSLTRSGNWVASTGSAYYRSTYLRTSTYGAALTTPLLLATVVAIRATTCPDCGTLRLYFGSTFLRTVSLYSPTRLESRFIPVLEQVDDEFGADPSRGVLTVKVASSDKEVTIDGVLATSYDLVPAWASADNPPVPAVSGSSHPVLAVDAGQDYTCATRPDGTVACWGDNAEGKAAPPPGTFTALSATFESRTCGIRTDGTLACWGKLRDEDQSDPWEVTLPSGTFTAVSDPCAIRIDGTIACWLGTNPPPGTFTALSAAWGSVCAVRTDGTLICWDQHEGWWMPLAGTFTAVGTGWEHICAIRSDGTVACLGDNTYAQSRALEGTFTALSAGFLFTCAIRTDGTLACWGDNEYGEATPPEGTFTGVSAGYNHACAIRTDGTPVCWGQNWSSQVTPRPTATIKTLAVSLSAIAVSLSWSARPALARVTSHDVRYRRAPWNGTFEPRVTWRSATTATSASFGASSGYTYCFSTRARDADGLLSSWTAETCTAVPLDDRSLTRSAGWTAGTGSSYYRSTYLRSSTAGAKLTRTGVVARRIALLATTCPTCGTVKVYWGSTLLRTVSLHSDTTVNRKLITVASYSGARTGTLTIRVTSSGRKVIIDGVAIRRN
jgi:alpha-tubulin suppressor-like RCC1 family protein